MTDKADPTPLTKAAAARFRTRARFFAVKETGNGAEEVLAALGVEDAPAVAVWRGGAEGSTVAFYDGPTKVPEKKPSSPE